MQCIAGRNLGLLLRLPLNESQAPGMVQHRNAVCAFAAQAAVAAVQIHQYVLLSADSGHQEWYSLEVQKCSCRVEAAAAADPSIRVAER